MRGKATDPQADQADLIADRLPDPVGMRLARRIEYQVPLVDTDLLDALRAKAARS